MILSAIIMLFMFVVGSSVLYVLSEKWQDMCPQEILTLLGFSFICYGLSGYLLYLMVTNVN
jgi:hypothetical protein